MGRGLDGLILRFIGMLCGFEGPRASARRRPTMPAPVSNNFRWLLRGGNTSSHSEQSS